MKSCSGFAAKDTVVPTEFNLLPTSSHLCAISFETGANSSLLQIATLKSFREVLLHSARLSCHPLDLLSIGPAITSKAISKSFALLAKGPQTDRSGSGTLGINS